MKRLALFSVFSKKLKDGEIKFFHNLEIESPRTNVLARTLRGLLALKKNSKNYNVLLIPDVENKNLFRAAANLPKAAALHPNSLNVYDILRYKNIFIDQKAVSVINSHFKLQ